MVAVWSFRLSFRVWGVTSEDGQHTASSVPATWTGSLIIRRSLQDLPPSLWRRSCRKYAHVVQGDPNVPALRIAVRSARSETDNVQCPTSSCGPTLRRAHYLSFAGNENEHVPLVLLGELSIIARPSSCPTKVPASKAIWICLATVFAKFLGPDKVEFKDAGQKLYTSPSASRPAETQGNCA